MWGVLRTWGGGVSPGRDRPLSCHLHGWEARQGPDPSGGRSQEHRLRDTSTAAVSSIRLRRAGEMTGNPDHWNSHKIAKCNAALSILDASRISEICRPLPRLSSSLSQFRKRGGGFASSPRNPCTLMSAAMVTFGGSSSPCSHNTQPRSVRAPWCPATVNIPKVGLHMNWNRVIRLQDIVSRKYAL